MRSDDGKVIGGGDVCDNAIKDKYVRFVANFGIIIVRAAFGRIFGVNIGSEREAS